MSPIQPSNTSKPTRNDQPDSPCVRIPELDLLPLGVPAASLELQEPQITASEEVDQVGFWLLAAQHFSR